MPLLVRCPNGCSIRVPASRAGRVVRCGQCKSAIRIAKVDTSTAGPNDWIRCEAKAVRPVVEVKGQVPDDPVEPVASPQVTEPESEAVPEVAPTELPTPAPTSLPTPLPAPEPTPASANEALPGPVELSAAESRASLADSLPKPTIDTRPNRPEPESLEMPRRSRPLAGPADSQTIPIINLNLSESQDDEDLPPKTWDQRLQDANADRMLLSRILALGLILVGLFNLVPAAIQLRDWTQLADPAPLPRWIYLQMMVGSLYVAYSVFLLQIPDWSALRSVSVAMLSVAFFYGVISTGLIVGEDGGMAGLLGIPFALNRQATIWCVAMLILATIMSYWAGRESWNWQRAESLLKQVMANSQADG